MDIDTRTFESELAHFGVKGMKWGVRKRREAKSGFDEPIKIKPGGDAKVKTSTGKATPVQVKVVPGKPVQTRGGKRHATVDEAIRSAALKQKLHSSGKQSLTNEEMRFLADRLTLEDRLSKVAPKPKAKGRVYAEALLKSPLPGFAIKQGQKQVISSMKGVGTAGQYQMLKGLEFAEGLLKTLQPLAKSDKKKKD